ncbi:hypothetical protein J6590_020195 [Homalodisca vitripennis]|nr:hypothetical protein J6590_020195 [Homalodisca vitripennis]
MFNLLNSKIYVRRKKICYGVLPSGDGCYLHKYPSKGGVEQRSLEFFKKWLYAPSALLYYRSTHCVVSYSRWFCCTPRGQLRGAIGILQLAAFLIHVASAYGMAYVRA